MDETAEWNRRGGKDAGMIICDDLPNHVIPEQKGRDRIVGFLSLDGRQGE
jgi:hypothetical protein